ncbi:hypothetical protein ALP74_200173 [Pseudomonas coronafaciens pv. garcae]|uniref:Uncharacterized protein n=1 Tax=Pseudomonas coronafaciens pv. garcae TaxID=251653 RepID=A0AB37QKJ0_9PSED|nr:hypothetical protein ALP74_200173 [Pseudomonas coronafaciens pv. garcae]
MLQLATRVVPGCVGITHAFVAIGTIGILTRFAKHPTQPVQVAAGSHALDVGDLLMRRLAFGGHQCVGITTRSLIIAARRNGFAGDPLQGVVGVANLHFGVVDGQQRLAIDQRVLQIEGPGVAVQCAAQGLGGLEHGFGPASVPAQASFSQRSACSALFMRFTFFAAFCGATQGLAVGKAGQGADAVECERVQQRATVTQHILRLLNIEVAGGVQGRLRVALHAEQRLAGEHQPGF